MAVAPKPRLTANKLGEYLVVGPARRHRILYDAKFPNDAVRPYYTPASEAIAQFIAGGMADLGILEKQAAALGNVARKPSGIRGGSTGTSRRLRLSRPFWMT